MRTRERALSGGAGGSGARHDQAGGIGSLGACRRSSILDAPFGHRNTRSKPQFRRAQRTFLQRIRRLRGSDPRLPSSIDRAARGVNPGSLSAGIREEGRSCCDGLCCEWKAHALDRANGVVDEGADDRFDLLRIGSGKSFVHRSCRPATARGNGERSESKESFRQLGEAVGWRRPYRRSRSAGRRVFAPVRPGEFDVELVEALVAGKYADPAHGSVAPGSKASLARPRDRPRRSGRLEVEALHALRELLLDVAVELARHVRMRPEVESIGCLARLDVGDRVAVRQGGGCAGPTLVAPYPLTWTQKSGPDPAVPHQRRVSERCSNLSCVETQGKEREQTAPGRRQVPVPHSEHRIHDIRLATTP